MSDPSITDQSMQDLTPPRGNGFKIATIILAVTTVLGIIWGIWGTVSYNNEKNQLAADQMELNGQQVDLKTAVARGRAFTAERDEARRNQQATQQRLTQTQSELQTSQAATQTATQCATFLYQGDLTLYGQAPASSHAIVAQLDKAVAPCKGVVEIAPPTP